MNVQLIQVPYDCGYKDTRQGLAADYFLKHNQVELLEEDGHGVQVKMATANCRSSAR